jgi:uncharacterized membrane protein HdeD (DUF308 family)
MAQLATEAHLLADRWWAVVLRGVAGIVFGALTFVMPVATLGALILLFGAYAFVDGLFNILAVVTGRTGGQRWWTLLLAGLGGIAAGLITFFMPGITALVLAYIIAGWALVIGALQIAAAIRLRHEIEGEWWLGLSGALSIVFGVIMLLAPGAGALAMVFWIGAYALLFGITLVVLGFRLRGWRSRDERSQLRRAA